VRTDWIRETLRPDDRVLDIGFAGTLEPFVHAAMRASLPSGAIVGLDIEISRVADLGYASTLVGDGFHLPFAERSFTVVVLAEVLEHLDDPLSLLAEAARVLQPGGRVMLTTPNPYHPPLWTKHWLLPRSPGSSENVGRYLGSPDHKQLHDPLSLCNSLHRCGFEVREIATGKFTIPFSGRLLGKPLALNLSFFPFSRLGSYLLVRAEKKRA
jgi:SAM-dependent methyltransferase